jgi:hypothetical protein
VKGDKYYSESQLGEHIYQIFGSLTKGEGLLNPAFQMNLIDTNQGSPKKLRKEMTLLNDQVKTIAKLVRKTQRKINSDNLGLSYLEKWARTLQRICRLYEKTKECIKDKLPWSENHINHYSIVIETSDNIE